MPKLSQTISKLVSLHPVCHPFIPTSNTRIYIGFQCLWKKPCWVLVIQTRLGIRYGEACTLKIRIPLAHDSPQNLTLRDFTRFGLELGLDNYLSETFEALFFWRHLGSWCEYNIRDGFLKKQIVFVRLRSFLQGLQTTTVDTSQKSRQLTIHYLVEELYLSTSFFLFPPWSPMPIIFIQAFPPP